MSIKSFMAPIYPIVLNITNAWPSYDTSSANLSVNYISVPTYNASENISNYQTILYLQTKQGLNMGSNASELSASADDMRKRTFAEIFFVSLALGCLILATIIGNIFVISAIILEK